MTLGKENSTLNNKSSHNQFQTSSPVSVLESSSSSSSSGGEKTTPLSPTHRGPQRARSKRPRPATFNPRAAMQLISPSSSSIENPQPFAAHRFAPDPDNFVESPHVKKIRTPAVAEHKKPKKIKITMSADPTAKPDHDPPTQAVRKCLHCEITKTPQWRAGPLGPKTLCNACGVRFKSGRLFPEYRPAASPTFVPSLHSNSHKKVLEMRNMTEPDPQPGNAAITRQATTEAEVVVPVANDASI